MNSKRITLTVACAAILALASCSGVKTPCTTNCGGGGGNASVNLVLTDTPPTGVTVLSFTLPIAGITLTPQSGSQVSIYPGGTFELTRLQSDTSGIAVNVSVPAGTYTSLNVTLGTSSGVYINSSGASITTSAGTCLNNAVCDLPTGGATTISIPINVTLSTNAPQFVGLDMNLNNAITTNNGISVDFTQANVLTVKTAPPIGTLPSGNTAYVDDFTGIVTAKTSNSVTIVSTVRGSLSAVVNSSTAVYDPQTLCGGNVSYACVQVGSVVSLQGVLSSSGTITATSLDVIDASTNPADEVEGTVYPANCNGGLNLGMILSDSSITNSSSPLASAKYGQGLCLTVNPNATYAIDTGILTGQPGVPTFAGFSSASDLLAGQTVRARITGAATGSSGINATANAMILRFSRLTATVSSTSGGTVILLTGLPAYITTFQGGAQALTYPDATLLENFTSISSLANPNVISFSALMLDPVAGVTYPLHVAKVRLQ